MNLLLQSRDETNGDVSKKRHSVAPICQHNNDEEEEAESSPDHLSGSVSSKDSHCSTGDDFVIVPNLVGCVPLYLMYHVKLEIKYVHMSNKLRQFR